MPSVTRWSLTDKFRLERTVGPYLKGRAEYTEEEFIEATEKAAEQHPNEWVVFITLAAEYGSVSRFADGLRASKRCVELRPDDIRSVFALATAYTQLALDASNEHFELLWQFHDKEEAAESEREHAKAELAKLGMAVETAAVQAMRWIERVLVMGPDSRYRAILSANLQTLWERFPHLR